MGGRSEWIKEWLSYNAFVIMLIRFEGIILIWQRMTIRHKITGKQYEVTIPHWEAEYVAKNIDSQYKIEQLDRIYKLYLVEGKKYLGKYEYAHARRLMTNDPRKYYYEESVLVEPQPPLESSQAIKENPAISRQPKNKITEILGSIW